MFSTKLVARARAVPQGVYQQCSQRFLTIRQAEEIERIDSLTPPTKIDGSLEVAKDPTGDKIIYEADVISGVPPEISRRSVRIFKPSKTAMQSGTAGSKEWKIDFDVQERWENKLMGWASSADAMQGVNIRFKTKEDAILFAERQGYDYWVEEPKREKERIKTYADNFKYVPGKLRLVKTK
ncbi:hypothetical protein HK104_004807 [Borealophlyctis nickersoniae]|nr:hypothetical protein HK104_004807 [Borealophlyctis nickersoniae]